MDRGIVTIGVVAVARIGAEVGAEVKVVMIVADRGIEAIGGVIIVVPGIVTISAGSAGIVVAVAGETVVDLGIVTIGVVAVARIGAEAGAEVKDVMIVADRGIETIGVTDAPETGIVTISAGSAGIVVAVPGETAVDLGIVTIGVVAVARIGAEAGAEVKVVMIGAEAGAEVKVVMIVADRGIEAIGVTDAPETGTAMSIGTISGTRERKVS
ncbi:orotate phosphoribosyltransferase [Trueperella bonasi]|uniref:Orotate phosphoribosyltransferase n=1 Tax=Trueperella bonasi TaxID=312286 RepID=A0ABT9NEV1_9ACTO|nr:hypothetical protein [Trueperella bonasi]MDP9805573.1 orotate phosphoribosyltransferase [Trueperella bonasi]